MIRFTLALFAALALPVLNAPAVTFFTGLDQVTDSQGDPVASSTLFLLVIDTDNNGFATPGADASAVQGTFLSGGDYIALHGDFSASGVDGVLFDSLIFTIGGPEIPENVPFALYYFPDLTSGTLMIPGGTSFGFYTSTNSSQFGSDSAWNTGANNGASYALNVFTVNNSGNLTENPDPSGVPDDVLQATLQTVPEPHAGVFALGGLVLLLCRRGYSPFGEKPV